MLKKNIIEADKDELLRRAGQTRERMRYEGMYRCCQYQASEGRDHHKPCANVRGTSIGGRRDGCSAQSSEEREVSVQSAVVGVDEVLRDDDAGDEVVVHEYVEGRKTGGDPKGSC
jgi:hypothetical protein